MTDTEFPVIPDTAEALAMRWAIRDAEYAKKPPMSLEMREAVRGARMREAGLLPHPLERAGMWARAQAWSPPLSADFGSMKDFLND